VGEGPEGLVDALLWDRGNRAHATRHGVSHGELDGMYESGEWIIDDDPLGRPGQYRLTGPTPSGRLITAVVEWVAPRRAYRPISAWAATPAEEKRWFREMHDED
jgi:hypothetical protein